MSRTVSINPLTRIEGHLAIHTETEAADGGLRVTAAHCEGEMYRGFESILVGRDPLDAQQITQRICGVCPISHGIASVRAQEAAYGITPSQNGRLMQNLILAANYIQSHILHFYHLAALDFVDVTAVRGYRGANRTLRALSDWLEDSLANDALFPAAPFLPRYAADYIRDERVNLELLSHYAEALEMRRLAHEMAAVFGAKLPHSTALVPGGATQEVTLERILAYRTRLKRLAGFVSDVYLPDVVTAAGAFPELWKSGRGCGDYLAYGAFETDPACRERWFPGGAVLDGAWEPLDVSSIVEDVRFSRFASASGLNPAAGETRADPRKEGAYSWLKAPRYRGRPVEVGPLARVMVARGVPGDHWIKTETDAVLASLGVPAARLDSVLGRHLCRVLEAQWLAAASMDWLEQLEIGGEPARDFDLPDRAQGIGLTEAPRGALGHWLTLEGHRIARYQCIVPTTWNCSPRDDAERPGPVETALTGTLIADPDAPMEPARIVRSFDPCLACAVH